MMKRCILAIFLAIAYFSQFCPILSAQTLLGFTAARGNPNASMTYEQTCNFSTTYRAYWLDPKEESNVPHEIGRELILAGAALTSLEGWTLDGRAILAVGYYLHPSAKCTKSQHPYPFAYESCVCKLDANTPCDCPTERSGSPANHKINLQQVRADKSHYYFQAGHMEASGCPDCYRLFRINLDGSQLFQMAGATFHGAEVSPVLSGVYELDGVGGIKQGHTCVIIRKDQSSGYFTDCGGPEKNVYARWSPDGTRLVFARGSTDPYQLSVALWNDDPQKILSKDLGNAPDFASNIGHNSSLIEWSPDSKWIYFSAYGKESNEIVRVEVLKDGSAGRRQTITTTQLTSAPHKSYPSPSSSDSGRYVAFTADSAGGALPWQLFLVDTENINNKPKTLLSTAWVGNDAFVLNPRWQPSEDSSGQ